ncbi:MAG: HAMP domain-containing protein [Methylococcaceae bacterium]|nr:HAMP domain-containing protein [Methylococcaceae bacterium]
MFKMKIISLGRGLVILLMFVVFFSLLSAFLLQQENAAIDEAWNSFETGASKKLSLIKKLDASIGYGGMIHNFKNYVIRQNKETYQRTKNKLLECEKILKRYQETSPVPEEKKALAVIGQTLTSYKEMLESVKNLTLQGKTTQEIDNIIKINDKPALDAIEQLQGIINVEIEEESNIVHSSLEEAKKTLAFFSILVSLLLIIAAVSVFWFVNTRVAKPLKAITNTMTLLAEGDLETDIPPATEDEIGEIIKAMLVFKENAQEKVKLEKDIKRNEINMESTKRNAIRSIAESLGNVMNAVAEGDLTQKVIVNTDSNEEMAALSFNLNQMIKSLAEITLEINQATLQMSSSIPEVNAALIAQSTGATEQVSVVNVASNTLNNIKTTSGETLKKASFLTELANKASLQSERGQQAIHESILGMDAITNKVEAVANSILDLSNKTQQISEITDVVDEIASQSKMLALNASIEAVKAGDAGLGFSVVAEEIRSLAEQSKESTAQVKTILQDIMESTNRAVMVTEDGTKQVSSGVILVQEAGEIIGQLDNVVKQTAQNSHEISEVVIQEAVEIEQIVQAMNDISTVANNAVLAIKQTEEAMKDLTTVSGKLKEQANRYTI